MSTFRKSMFGRKVAAAIDGAPSARLLVLGHSHCAGQGAGPTGGTSGAAPYGFCEKLAYSLGEYGLSAMRTGWMGDYNTSVDSTNINTFDPRISFGTGWASHATNGVLGGKHIWQNGTTANKGFLTFQPGFEFSRARVWYPTSTGLSTQVGLYLDDALFSEFSQSAANSLTSVTLEAMTPKTTLKAKENAGLNAFWNGVEFYPTDKPDIAITVAGARGQKTADFVEGSVAWSSLHGLESFNADMTVLYTLTNDLVTGVSVATFKANLASLAVTSVVRGNCIIVIDPPGNNAVFWNGTYEAYAEAAASVATQYGCGFLDLRKVFSRSWGKASSDGLMSDALHPNDTGHAYIADLLAAEIMRFVS